MAKYLIMLIGVVFAVAVTAGCQSQQAAQDNSFDNFSPSTGLQGFHATSNTWSPDTGQGTPFPRGFRGF